VVVPPLAVPVELGREEARDAAADELSRSIYQQSRPGLTERVLTWLYEQVSALLDRLSEASPGGGPGLVVLVLLVVAAVVAVRLAVGPVRASAREEEPLFVGGPRSAAEHRASAEAHAAAGRWAEAVRDRLRAVIRSLEERSLLDARPGRTADEAAAEAGRVLPDQAAALRTAARVFDDVWYGGRRATEQDDALLRDLDDRVRRARPVHLSPAGPPPA
jgi:hypothetical protein